MKTKILLVDDNPILLKSMKHILFRDTYEIIEASTGKEALEIINEVHPDIILLDINLSDMNGLEICKEVKSRPDNCTLVLIVSSINISSDQQAQGLEYGSDGYITRPVPNREFLARVDSLVRIKKSEDKLREANELNKRYTQEIESTLNTLNKIMDYSLDIICTLHEEGKFISINNACQTILGYKPEELINKPFTDFIHSDDIEKTINYSIELKTGITTHNFENRYIRRDGEIVNLMWSSYWAEQEKTIFAIARDITEKKALEEQFFRIQKLESLGTLVGGVAHNLNNALTPILMAVDILKNNLCDERSQRILETVRSSTLHATEMVKQVLSFTKGTEGLYEILKLALLLKEIEKIIFETFPKKINISFDIAEDLWNIKGDSNQIKQVIMNIFMNSKDVLSDSGTIRLNAENIIIDQNYAKIHPDLKIGPYILLEISDSGPGIPKEIINRVFDPFFTTKSIGKGTGLGLSTAMSVIRSHNGVINIYSEHGKGTTVKIYLPAFKTPEPTQFNEEPKHSHGNNELILVIDDEKSILDLLDELLSSFGYRVITASDGIEGIDLYMKNIDEIKLVISDMVMPNMDGLSTVRALLKINPALKIIMASGFDSNDKIAEVMELGVSDFLEKPYTIKRLLKAVNKVFS